MTDEEKFAYDRLKYVADVFALYAEMNVFQDIENNCLIMTARSKLRPDKVIVTSAGHGTGFNTDHVELYYNCAKTLHNEGLFWSAEPTISSPVFLGTPEEVEEYNVKRGG